MSRTDALGDTILTLPVAQAIKEKYPSSKVIFLVAPRSADLFKDHLHVDECLIFNHSHNFLRKCFFLLKIMYRYKFTHFFHVGGSFIPSFMAFIMRIPFRGGIVSRWKSFLFLNKGVRQKRSFVEMHEVEYNLNLLRPLDIHYHFSQKNSYVPSIVLKEEERQKAFEEFSLGLKEMNIPVGEFVVVHPGMMGHTLNWSITNYLRLLLKLEELSPLRFTYVVSFTPGDSYYVNILKRELELSEYNPIKGRVHFYDGSRKGLRNFMGILSYASAFVGPSTGPTHLAAALGVRTLGLYSPIKTQSSWRWGPVVSSKEKMMVMVPDVACGEIIRCLGERCPYFECMEKLEVEDVLDGLGKLLKII